MSKHIDGQHLHSIATGDWLTYHGAEWRTNCSFGPCQWIRMPVHAASPSGHCYAILLLHEVNMYHTACSVHLSVFCFPRAFVLRLILLLCPVACFRVHRSGTLPWCSSVDCLLTFVVLARYLPKAQLHTHLSGVWSSQRRSDEQDRSKASRERQTLASGLTNKGIRERHS